jgi:CSLREA domain-containing protein
VGSTANHRSMKGRLMNRKLLHATRNAFVTLGCMACSSAALAANIDVTTTSDTIANDGSCSLREAIINANTNSRLFAAAGECAAGSGVDTINLPAGTYTLAIAPAGANDATTGSLNITASINIIGVGNPTVQGGAGWADRVFDISAAVTVSMSGFTVTGGNVTAGNGVDGGGGVRSSGALALSNMTISGNTARPGASSSASGGGVYVPPGGSLTLTNSTIAGNHADYGAGILVFGQLDVNGSTISGNQGTKAQGLGAGIYVLDALANITNSTISGNFVLGGGAGFGNGIMLDTEELSQPHGVVNLNNVTIANNSANYGGGIGVTSGTINMSNTIVAGNSTSAGAPDCTGTSHFSINSNGNNLIGDNTGCTISGVKASDKIGTGASPINPLLGALDSNGGATQTMPLRLGSLAINGGANATCAAMDQRGIVRPQGLACDIGAFELVADNGGTVVEFFNTTLGHYFITANPAEQASIDAGGSGPGWTRTGNNFKSGGLSGVCRFYGTPGVGPNSHFYTVDVAECAQVRLDPGWHFESYDFGATPPIAGTCANGTVPVYRAYNNGFAQNDSNHRYSTNIAIYNGQISLGWSGEGVVFCAPA